MCGISGISSTRGVLKSLVEESISRIGHRGPDETGFFASDSCVLGMCRLAIIDVSRGQQPNYNSDRSIISIFNGEIYNFFELRKNLVARGHQIQGVGDSALIPYLYQEYGDEFAKLLQGMFAIAIYDSNLQEIILVRDRLGKKPLWYYFDKDTLSFSSELKGLLALGIPKLFETNVISEFLQFGYINAPRSPYKNVFQLPPASILKRRDKDFIIKTYWNPSDVKTIDISYESALEETENIIRDAVRARLVSERPIGSFLSGGIDSTIVTALMREESKSQVHTFSIGFRDEKFDESIHATKVADAIGTIHHNRILDADPKFLIERLGSVLDVPFADSSVIPTFLLAEYARNDVVVALSGDGGDEGFGGYQRYRAAKSLNRINPLLVLNPLSQWPGGKLSNPRIRKLIKHSKVSSLSDRYRGFQSLFQDSDLQNLLNGDLCNDLNKEIYNQYWNRSPSGEVIRKLQEVDIRSYLPGDLLFKVDIASMANSLEVRSPFLDYRVVEWGLSLPAKFKFKGNENKFLLREIARKYVPRELIDRPKMGFGIPRSRWLRNELHSVVRDVLLDSTGRSRGWFQIPKVEKTLKMHDEGYELDNLIWPMFMLELWAKNWLD